MSVCVCVYGGGGLAIETTCHRLRRYITIKQKPKTTSTTKNDINLFFSLVKLSMPWFCQIMSFGSAALLILSRLSPILIGCLLPTKKPHPLDKVNLSQKLRLVDSKIFSSSEAGNGGR